ncbi:MAG: hypothetical protein GX117_09870 [Candidatus Hydrogenedentes bacterium]|jgi:hypothetical protein|nr:hypothetical protein [Candidatus Hydrogenedentota bacterium]
MPHSKSFDDPLTLVVNDFIRESLKFRYSLENLRSFHSLDSVPNHTLLAVHHFLIHRLFPEWEERCRQDAYFEQLQQLLNNAMRLAPLTAVALKSLFRFGRNLPKAVNIGKLFIKTFEATRSLEKAMTEALVKRRETHNSESMDASVTQAMLDVGRERFLLYVDDIVALMELLNERSLLQTSLSVLTDIVGAMEIRRDAYSTTEIEGGNYAIRTISEGIALFDTLSPEMVHSLLSTIPKVETAWFDRATGT